MVLSLIVGVMEGVEVDFDIGDGGQAWWTTGLSIRSIGAFFIGLLGQRQLPANGLETGGANIYRNNCGQYFSGLIARTNELLRDSSGRSTEL